MPTSATSDKYYLRETLKLAKKGLGWTNPNPMVGSVIVRGDKVVARGYHKGVGLPHAEVVALNQAQTKAKGATLYTNLEPCSHHDRTPPCADAIISAGIKRIVCSTLDPNPRVNGRGIAKLKRAGIAVSVGLLEEKSRVLNDAFFTFHKSDLS
jgi:diaminohydroxyphosphoribosylaminopyrimidine deaminase / 5-amino-6-(5-phosphoribosylamino)uracil reductase